MVGTWFETLTLLGPASLYIWIVPPPLPAQTGLLLIPVVHLSHYLTLRKMLISPVLA